jgi:hypothetical protein
MAIERIIHSAKSEQGVYNVTKVTYQDVLDRYGSGENKKPSRLEGRPSEKFLSLT